MQMPATLTLLALAAGFAALCRWRGSRPLDIARGPRMVPWAALMLGSIVACVLLLVHMVNLLGVETGRP